MGGPLVRILDTGVRVLPQREWEEREREIYRSLYGTLIRIDADGTLVLPCLPGETLATLLEDPELEESVRRSAIERAVVALADFHRLGFTHGDAMAENVLVDLEAGVAHWLISRPFMIRLVRSRGDAPMTCVHCSSRVCSEPCPGNVPRRCSSSWMSTRMRRVARVLATNFTSVLRRPLTFHLGQARLSFEGFREIGRMLR